MRRIGILFAVCIALAGCSTKFVYNNMDWLLLEYLDDYVELNDAQERTISTKIALLSEWHRSEEVPNYIDHLDELMAIEPSSFTIEELKLHEAKFQRHSERLVERVTPELTVLAADLSDEQVEELMDSIRVRHYEYKDKYAKLDESEIKQRYKERIADRLETWLGKLTDEQQVYLDRWVDELYVTSYDWINHQTKMRVEVNGMLAERVNMELFQPQFQQFMFNPSSFYAPELELKIDHNRSVANRYIVQIVNSMTEKQTDYYRDELQDWKDLALAIQ